MDNDPLLWYIVIQIIVYIALATLSASKAAVECLTEGDIEKHTELSARRLERLRRLLQKRDELTRAVSYTSILLIAVSVALTGSSLGNRLARALEAAWGLSTGVTALIYTFGAVLICLALCFLLITFGVTMPAHIARAHYMTACGFAWKPLAIARKLSAPFTGASSKLAGLLYKSLRIETAAEPDTATEDEIRMLVDRGEERGAIESDEKEMIENVFELNNTVASDIMTPRTDVSFIHIEDNSDTIINTIVESGHSRFPVYGEDTDDILGILNARDYLLNLRLERPKRLHELLRDAYFIPETARADDVFRDMQQKKMHIAVVVDEYGGTSGILTMEDLLEQIVGNIYDEFDPMEEEEIKQTGENQWRILGSASLESVEEALGIKLPEDEESDTFGGFVLTHLGSVPDDGARPELEACGLSIRVERIADRLLESAVVSILPAQQTE